MSEASNYLNEWLKQPVEIRHGRIDAQLASVLDELAELRTNANYIVSVSWPLDDDGNQQTSFTVAGEIGPIRNGDSIIYVRRENHEAITGEHHDH